MMAFTLIQRLIDHDSDSYPRLSSHRRAPRTQVRPRTPLARRDRHRRALDAVGAALRERHWALQREAGLDVVTVGDFALYDQVVNHIQLFGCEPGRFGFTAADPAIARMFTLARGVADEHGHDAGCGCAKAGGGATAALEMTKWFDTNYHYLVPEFDAQTTFTLSSHRLLAEVLQAQALGHTPKVALIGPLTFLWLGKEKQPGFETPGPPRETAAGLRRAADPAARLRCRMGAARRAHPRTRSAGSVGPGFRSCLSRAECRQGVADARHLFLAARGSPQPRRETPRGGAACRRGARRA